jgi:hypothetical protein
MGNPAREDTHPLHGELPNAPYGTAWVAAGTDGRSPYIAVGGEYRHTVAFACDYTARPRVALRGGEAVVPVVMEIRNQKKSPMELMYLAHVNFLPLDGGRLVSPAPATPEAMRVRTNIPVDLSPPAGYREFLKQLAADPARHQLLKPGMAFDPEVVFLPAWRIKTAGCEADAHPDGCASTSVRGPHFDHASKDRRTQTRLPRLILPATAEPDGYLAEKAKGNVKTLAAGQSVRFELEAGLLTPGQASEAEEGIAEVLRRR